jgi:hypothetical protein
MATTHVIMTGSIRGPSERKLTKMCAMMDVTSDRAFGEAETEGFLEAIERMTPPTEFILGAADDEDGELSVLSVLLMEIEDLGRGEAITDVTGRYTIAHSDLTPLKNEAQYVVLNVGKDDSGCASDYNALDAAFELARSIQSVDPERARAIETSLVNNFGPAFELDWGEDAPSAPSNRLSRVEALELSEFDF